METYILEPDTIGKKTLDHLTNAALRGLLFIPPKFIGCEVKLIYDYLGSQRLNETHLWKLKKAGGNPIAFNPLFTWPWNIKHWGIFRNHRQCFEFSTKVEGRFL